MTSDEGARFTTDWFTQRTPLWEQHLGDLRGRPNLRYLEIGSFEGRSLLWVMENLLVHPASHAHAVDSFAGGEEHADPRWKTVTLLERFQRNLASHLDRVTVHVGDSKQVLSSPDLGTSQFDLIYVDGSHRARDVFVDAVKAWALLAPGGVIVFDDYLWTVMPSRLQRPKLGVDLFAWWYRRDAELVFSDYQVAFRKTRATEHHVLRRFASQMFPVLLAWMLASARLGRRVGVESLAPRRAGRGGVVPQKAPQPH